jgi:hypothetical protein
MSQQDLGRLLLGQEHFVKRLAGQAWLRARLNAKKTLTLDNLGESGVVSTSAVGGGHENAECNGPFRHCQLA